MNSSASSRFSGVNVEYLLAARVAGCNWRFLPIAEPLAFPAGLVAASGRRCNSDTVCQGRSESRLNLAVWKWWIFFVDFL